MTILAPQVPQFPEEISQAIKDAAIKNIPQYLSNYTKVHIFSLPPNIRPQIPNPTVVLIPYFPGTVCGTVGSAPCPMAYLEFQSLCTCNSDPRWLPCQIPCTKSEDEQSPRTSVPSFVISKNKPNPKHFTESLKKEQQTEEIVSQKSSDVNSTNYDFRYYGNLKESVLSEVQFWDNLEFDGSPVLEVFVPSPISCHLKCYSTERCQCWNFNISTNNCTLKTNCTKISTNSTGEVTYSTKFCETQNAVFGSTFSANTTKRRIQTRTADECNHRCSEWTNCSCWSFTSQNDTVCSLLTDCTETLYDDLYVSAYRSCCT